MATPFDHVQRLLTSETILGGTATVTVALSTTETELFRFYVNPGFNGTLSWIEGVISEYQAGSEAHTIMAQIRCRGEATWTDLWAAYKTGASAGTVNYPFFLDGAAGTNTSPVEIRVMGKHASTGTVTVTHQNGTIYSSVRIVGESV